MLAQLRHIFPHERITTAPEHLAAWGTDWTRTHRPRPAAVVFPQTVGEVAALTRLANRVGGKLVPSGGRTGLSGGAVAGDSEVVVSFDRMNRILGFDATDRVARCQAGVVTQALHMFAEAHGLHYPVDFASAGSSQVGGNVATNAGGIKVIRYGMTRDWIAGLVVVTGKGDVLDLNGALVKNATGYDLRHLFIGSEGTLGFIVEADVRLTTPPPPRRVMVLGLDRLPSALTLLERFRAAATLSAFECFSELALAKVTAHRGLPRPFATPCSFYALLEFDAEDEATALTAFEDAVAAGEASDGVLSQSEAQAQALWALREGITESIAPQTPYKHDLSVRPSETPAFLAAVDRLVAAHYPDVEVCWFGHIGDGNLHLNILRPPGEDAAAFHERCHAISPALFDVVRAHGGSISAEHGIGLAKRDFLGFARADNEIAIMRAVKAAFDPRGVMNPGKLLS